MKEEFEKLIARKGLKDQVVVGDGGCYGRCTKGPNVLIIGPIPDELWPLYREQSLMPGPDGPPAQMYNGVLPPDCRELLESHCEQGTVLERLREKQRPATFSETCR